MNIISLQQIKEAYIWAARVLVGPDLLPRNNILLEIRNQKICSLNNLAKTELSTEVASHKHLFLLDNEITLLSSMIDAHVHLALDGKDSKAAIALWNQQEMLSDRVQQDLDVYLTRGIGFVRDGGDRREINLRIGNMFKQGMISGPGIVSTGQAVRKANHYGSLLGEGYSSAEEIPTVISRLRSRGADQIKVILSGAVSFKEYGKVEPAALNLKELKMLVKYAHRNGSRVMAHANSKASVNLAIRGMVDSIEHGYFLSSESLKKMAAQQTAWVPTIIPVAVQVKEPMLHNRSKAEIAIINRTYRRHMEQLLPAKQMGVPLGLGTDSGAPGVRHGLSLFEEITLYSEAGLSNRDILQSVTATNARILGLADRLGTLEVNQSPYLMGVFGDPLTDLNALKKIKWLFKI